MKRVLPFLVCCAVLACARQPERPSVLLIVLDTLRADYTGFGGFDAPVSPALDAFAGECVRFEHAYAAAPWTKPSMASLFTSTYPLQHGVTNHDGRLWGAADSLGTVGVLPADAVTLAEHLAHAGYRTAGFVANPWLAAAYGFDQGFAVYEELFGTAKTRADTVLEVADHWLAGQSKTPWFAYVHLMDVHGPYDAPDTFVDRVRAAAAVDTLVALDRREVNAIPAYLRDQPWATGWDQYRLHTWRARYAAGVAWVDETLGRTLDAWTSAGFLENTIVIITSDHGEELFDHGGWDHGKTLYEEQVRVPLLLRLPGGRSASAVSNPVRLIDLLPTLLDLLDLEAPAGAMGRSLAPLWRGQTLPPAPVFFTATREQPEAVGLVWNRWKVLSPAGGAAPAVYNLAADPGERRNLALEDPALADSLGAILRWVAAGAALAPPALAPGPATLDAAARERLRSLGYLN